MKNSGLFLLIVVLLFGCVAFAMEQNIDMNKTARQTSLNKISLATVPGKLVFQSNRDGALSEIWILEKGKLRKIASSLKTPKDLPAEVPDVLQKALANLEEPKLSMDGSRILCTNDDHLIILGSDGNVLKKIKTKKYPNTAEWSPDNSSIYYAAADRLPDGSGTFNIYKLSLNDLSEKQITHLSPMPGVRRILSFSISPDDKTIAFQMWGEQEYGISIWKINTDGTDLKLLVKYAGDPKWSPDGTKLAYVTKHLPTGEEISKFLEIFVLDVKSGKTTRITNNEWEEHHPVFSPDGTKIAFKSARHSEIVHGSEIFVINLDGTDEARLTSPQPNPKYPNDPVRGWATDECPDWSK